MIQEYLEDRFYKSTHFLCYILVEVLHPHSSLGGGLEHSSLGPHKVVEKGDHEFGIIGSQVDQLVLGRSGNSQKSDEENHFDRCDLCGGGVSYSLYTVRECYFSHVA